MTYGEIVKDARKRMGFTLEGLGQRIGVAKGYLSQIETGRFPPPAKRITKKLAKALGLDSNDMLVKAWVEKAPVEIREAVAKAVKR